MFKKKTLVLAISYISSTGFTHECCDCGKDLQRDEIEYLENICCDCESKTDWYKED